MKLIIEIFVKYSEWFRQSTNVATHTNTNSINYTNMDLDARISAAVAGVRGGNEIYTYRIFS